MIGAAILGAWLGAGVVAAGRSGGCRSAWARAARRRYADPLHAAAGADRRRILPLGGDALGVRGTLLVVAIAGNFLLGALMTLGIGLYAPCMILVSFLGMKPTAASRS